MSDTASAKFDYAEAAGRHLHDAQTLGVEVCTMPRQLKQDGGL